MYHCHQIIILIFNKSSVRPKALVTCFVAMEKHVEGLESVGVDSGGTWEVEVGRAVVDLLCKAEYA